MGREFQYYYYRHLRADYKLLLLLAVLWAVVGSIVLAVYTFAGYGRFPVNIGFPPLAFKIDGTMTVPAIGFGVFHGVVLSLLWNAAMKAKKAARKYGRWFSACIQLELSERPETSLQLELFADADTLKALLDSNRRRSSTNKKSNAA